MKNISIVAKTFHLCIAALLRVMIGALWTTALVANAQSQKPDFSWSSWSPGDKFESFKSVHFASGGIIRVAVGSESDVPMSKSCRNAYKHLEISKDSKNGQFFGTPVCDDSIHIRAAYPSRTNAKVAIATTNCGGTICSTYEDHFLIYNGKHGLIVTKVGTSHGDPGGRATKYSFWFKGASIEKSTIANFFNGQKNELGDLLASNRNFISRGGYIDSRFNTKFVEFIGEHPESILSNEVSRLPITNMVTPEQFRDLRSTMSGPGSSTLVDGRFIVFNGCMRSNCSYRFGSIVLDGFNGELQVLQFNLETKQSSIISTRSLDEMTDYVWVDEVETFSKVELRIDKKEMMVKFNK